MAGGPPKGAWKYSLSSPSKSAEGSIGLTYLWSGNGISHLGSAKHSGDCGCGGLQGNSGVTGSVGLEGYRRDEMRGCAQPTAVLT